MNLISVLRQRLFFLNGWRCFFLLLALASAGGSVNAEHTRLWRQSGLEEFLRGTAHGVAVRSDGRLELAPRFALMADADTSYLWALRLDAKGTLFAAGGAPAKVFRFDSKGKPSVVFESSDLAAQAIAFDSRGQLYVATSPDGKVYRVSSSGEKSVFFEPKTKYIWDLAFGADGRLYVATGDKGQVFAVNPDGKGDVFYTSDEAHIRVLAFDAKNNLIAGTEPSGRIIRITRDASNTGPAPGGSGAAIAASAGASGFVLYETAKREVTSLAIAPDGAIYAAAIGEKQHFGAPSSATIISNVPGVTNLTAGTAVQSQTQAQASLATFSPALSSSIYRISPDGAPEELWSSRDEIVYSIGLGPDGRLLAGTGSNGALLVIDGRGVYAQLAKAGSAQITGIARNSSGKVFLCGANPGKVYSLGPDFEAEGTFETAAFDAKLFSQWGRLEWWSPPPVGEGKTKKSADAGEPRLEFFVRSGNTEDPGKEWSKWFGPYAKSGTAVGAPAARFVQWKAILHGGSPGDGIDWVTLAYLPHNVAPVIESVVLQDPGVRAQLPIGLITGQGTSVNLKMPQQSGIAGLITSQPSGAAPRFDLQPQGTAQRGYQSVLWSVRDDNDDEMRFSVFYRGEMEREWKLLKDNLEQKFYSWDTATMPDGAYYLKIVASDLPSNPPAMALQAERESERFEIDNTPPVIENFKAVINKSRQHEDVRVRFTATDGASSIGKAQYSVDSADWTLVAPIGAISDAPAERYDFTLPDFGPGEHTISVRVFDRFENVGSAKTTVTR